MTDPLTGLPNTRFLFSHAGRELARAARLNTSVTLLLLDLDNLKTINDSFGHQAGNRAICGVAAVLRGAIRPYDVCVRYGGDEFIVLLSDCGVDQAEAKRLELQSAVEAIPFSVGELMRVRLSISAGAACLPGRRRHVRRAAPGRRQPHVRGQGRTQAGQASGRPVAAARRARGPSPSPEIPIPGRGPAPNPESRAREPSTPSGPSASPDLDPHHVVAGVHEQDLARDARALGAEQEAAGRADFLQLDVAAQRARDRGRPAGCRRSPRCREAASVLIGPGGDRVDADVLRAEVGRPGSAPTTRARPSPRPSRCSSGRRARRRGTSASGCCRRRAAPSAAPRRAPAR